VIAWAWRTSAQVALDWRLRLKFVLAALRNPGIAGKLQHPDPPLAGLLRDWPDTAGFLLWPYQCSSWQAVERFKRIDDHLHAIAKMDGLDLALNEKLVLADLGELSPGVSLILDRAKWLAREGHLTLSLFKDDFRAFTVAFSFSEYPHTEMFIGGLQGRNDPEALNLYRDLTKHLHGTRPRDFILEAARLFANKVGVKRIYAVSDDHKISRHRYFGKRGAPGLFYDDVWIERGGTRVADSHFEIPLSGNRREIEDIPAKKRSMYRRRYQMFDEIASAMEQDLGKAERRSFEAT